MACMDENCSAVKVVMTLHDAESDNIAELHRVGSKAKHCAGMMW